MTEQERAAALAGAVSHTADVYTLIDGGFAIYFNKAEWSTIEAALRLLAATPAASSEVREPPHAEFGITGETDARKIGAPEVRGPYVDVRGLCSSIESRDGEARERVAAAILPTVLRVRRDFRGITANNGASLIAFAAISSIRPGDRLPAGVVVPEEPTEAMEEAFHNAMEVDFEVQRQRCLKEGISWKSLFYIVWRAAVAAAKEPTP